MTSTANTDGTVRRYTVTGPLFFASANELVHDFDLTEPVSKVIIDLTDSEVWDSSAVAILDQVVAKFTARGVDATITGLADHSAELHERLTGQLVDAD